MQDRYAPSIVLLFKEKQKHQAAQGEADTSGPSVNVFKIRLLSAIYLKEELLVEREKDTQGMEERSRSSVANMVEMGGNVAEIAEAAIKEVIPNTSSVVGSVPFAFERRPPSTRLWSLTSERSWRRCGRDSRSVLSRAS